MAAEYLPKALARSPYVRALSMKVFPVSPRELIVVGGTQPHSVMVSNGSLHCDCVAGSFRSYCAHTLAVQHLYQQKESPMTFTTNRGAVKERALYVPLPRRGLYGGLLAGWWTYTRNNAKTGEQEPRIGMRLLVTHISGKNWEKLDDITEAVAFFSTSFFHNAKTGKESYLFTAARALTGMSATALQALSDSELEQLIDDAVGTGVVFMAEPVEDKTTKEYSGNIASGDTFEQSDPAFSKLASAMASKIVIETSDGEDQRRYIKSPKPTELSENAEISSAAEAEEIPF